MAEKKKAGRPKTILATDVEVNEVAKNEVESLQDTPLNQERAAIEEIKKRESGVLSGNEFNKQRAELAQGHARVQAESPFPFKAGKKGKDRFFHVVGHADPATIYRAVKLPAFELITESGKKESVTVYFFAMNYDIVMGTKDDKPLPANGWYFDKSIKKWVMTIIKNIHLGGALKERDIATSRNIYVAIQDQGEDPGN